MSSIEQFSDAEVMAALLSHDTHYQAAESLGCSTKTLQRRLKEEGFTQAMEEARWIGLETFLAKTQIALPEAVNTIIKVMRTSPDLKVQYQSAARLIELGTRATDLLDNKMQQVPDA